MKTFPWIKVGLLLFFLLVLWLYFSGIPTVPFHPDESTQIYMSADTRQPPSTLAYNPSSNTDGRMRYRLIDAPLTHTLIGWGLMIQGRQSLQADWDWSQSWVENKTAGALPTSETLMAARWSVAWLFPLTCLFLFLAVRKIDGAATAVFAVLLTASNALVLIHTRRAMAESAMLCALCMALWWMTQNDWRFWLSAIPLGLAINAKQTILPIAGVGFMQILLQHKESRYTTRVIHVAGFLAVLLTISWILNPVYWSYPVEAAQTGIALRQDLSNRMRIDYHSTSNPIEQIAYLISRTFIQSPAIADVANYEGETRDEAQAYLSQPMNNLFRSFNGGAFLLILTLGGLAILTRRVLKNKNEQQYPAAVFLAITLVSVLTVLLFTPVPFQRYYTLLVPLFSTAQAIAITGLATILLKRYKKGLSRF